MSRPQFRLSTLLWLIFGAACFFGGMGLERRLEKRRLSTAWDKAVETGVITREVLDAVVTGERSVLTMDSDQTGVPAPGEP